MRIGIYGGSFNPIHNGHTRLSQEIVAQGIVDELWLMVSPLKPLKQDVSADIAEYDHRLTMAKLATQELDGVTASDFERHLPLPSYTIHTLHALSAAYPEHDFSLIVGADNWERFPHWYNADEIVSQYNIYVYRRPHITIDEASLPPTVRIVDTPLFDISSTQIREAARRGESLAPYVDTRVEQYIRDNHLYV